MASLGGDAARAPVRPHRRRHRDDVVEQPRLDRRSRCSSTSIANIDGAARDVQAAINAARSYLPAEPADEPDVPQGQPGRLADPDPGPDLRLHEHGTDVRRRVDASCSRGCRRVEGVGQVIVGGSSLPAVRVELNPQALSRHDVGLEDVRAAIAATNVRAADRTDGGRRHRAADRHRRSAAAGGAVPAAHRRVARTARRCASATSPTCATRSRTCARGGMANGKPAVLLIIFRQPGRQHHRDRRSRARGAAAARGVDPAGVKLAVVLDRTTTIRASVRDVERSLLISVDPGDRWWCSSSCAARAPP